jgi:hypothetical protein
MPSTAASFAAGVRPDERLGVLFEELAELAGQRNAIDGRIVEIVAELDHDELWGATGARSVAALVAWKAGTSPSNAETIAAVARRLEEFPRCAAGMREGRLSLDQVGVIAKGAAEGSDAHYAELARCATVNQLRTAVCEVWFERDGQVIGAGRTTRLISRRLRRALEHRDRSCAVPGCGATRGLHAHHIRHWEDGGLTELANLVLLCPYHHRLHHRGVITITGPAANLVVTDSAGRPLSAGSLAGPQTKPPPAVAPCPGPTGERANWWWYQPFQAQPPPTTN